MYVCSVRHRLTKVEFSQVDDLDYCGSDEAIPHLDQEVAALVLTLGNAIREPAT